MGFFDKVERKLESAYNGVFAKAFKADVQPVELASAIRTAMDDRAATHRKGGRSIVPNAFLIELSTTDYERLLDDEELENDLVAAAEAHAESQRYQPGGPFDIIVQENTDLETGAYHLQSGIVANPAATGFTGQQPILRDEDPDRMPSAAPPSATPAPAPPSAAAHAGAPAAAGAAAGAAAASGHREPHREPPREGILKRTALPDRPWLDIDGDRYPLTSSMTVVGRDDTAHIILDDPGVSRQHCEIRVTVDGRHLLSSVRDLGSTNGTFVNGERITSERLEDGDQLTIGRTSMIFRAGRA